MGTTTRSLCRVCGVNKGRLIKKTASGKSKYGNRCNGCRRRKLGIIRDEPAL